MVAGNRAWTAAAATSVLKMPRIDSRQDGLQREGLQGLGHEPWFQEYLSGVIFLSLIVYTIMIMRDTKHRSAMHRHE